MYILPTRAHGVNEGDNDFPDGAQGINLSKQKKGYCFYGEVYGQ